MVGTFFKLFENLEQCYFLEVAIVVSGLLPMKVETTFLVFPYVFFFFSFPVYHKVRVFWAWSRYVFKIA